MPVSKEQVLATAALCRVDLSVNPDCSAPDSGARIERIASELASVVRYMDILNQVDTEGIQPLYSPLRHVAKPRLDEAEKRLGVDEVLANAPKRQQNFFAVPPVIG